MTFTDQMLKRECEAAAVFESRWTLRALRRVDADLHQAVVEQRGLFHEALVTGTEADVREHGEAMCRGWAVVVQRMEAAQEPEDAFLIGVDTQSGTRVAISEQRASSARVRELWGDRVVFLSPDEVAAMFAGLQTVATVKALWPGAEITDARPKPIDRYPDEPAKGDGELGLDTEGEAA